MVASWMYKLLGYIVFIAVAGYWIVGGLIVYLDLEDNEPLIFAEIIWGLVILLLLSLVIVFVGRLYIKFGSGKLTVNKWTDRSVALGLISIVGLFGGYGLAWVVFKVFNLNGEGALALVAPGIVLLFFGFCAIICLIIGAIKAYKAKKIDLNTSSFSNQPKSS